MTPLDACTAAIARIPTCGKRKLVALAGPPASGKSTLAATLATRLCAQGTQTQVVPMDGFHLDNNILTQRGLLPRKGAPETFDVASLLSLIARLKTGGELSFPLFDRGQDRAIAGAGHLRPDCEVVIIEGNYLLLKDPDWTPMHAHWDLSVLLSVPLATLKERLVARWITHGLSTSDAERRASKNDLRNAQLVMEQSGDADLTLNGTEPAKDRREKPD